MEEKRTTTKHQDEDPTTNYGFAKTDPVNPDQDDPVQAAPKENKKHRKHTWQIISAVLAAALVSVSVLSVRMDSSRQSLSEKTAALEKETDSQKKKVSDLQKENSELSSQLTAAKQQNSELQNENQTLSSKNNELENGAAAQLVAIKNAHESGDWQGTIDKYNALHEKYNGSAEDQEAKALAEDAQAQLDAEKKKQEEEEAKGYETGITYDQLARTPDDYNGKKVKFSGEVVQVIEGDDNITELRVAVNDNYDTILFVMYNSDIVSSRVLEDDEITIYGKSVGNISYQSTMGGKITIPAVTADKIDQ